MYLGDDTACDFKRLYYSIYRTFVSTSIGRRPKIIIIFLCHRINVAHAAIHKLPSLLCCVASRALNSILFGPPSVNSECKPLNKFSNKSIHIRHAMGLNTASLACQFSPYQKEVEPAAKPARRRAWCPQFSNAFHNEVLGYTHAYLCCRLCIAHNIIPNIFLYTSQTVRCMYEYIGAKDTGRRAHRASQACLTTATPTTTKEKNVEHRTLTHQFFAIYQTKYIDMRRAAGWTFRTGEVSASHTNHFDVLLVLIQYEFVVLFIRRVATTTMVCLLALWTSPCDYSQCQFYNFRNFLWCFSLFGTVFFSIFDFFALNMTTLFQLFSARTLMEIIPHNIDKMIGIFFSNSFFVCALSLSLFLPFFFSCFHCRMASKSNFVRNVCLGEAICRHCFCYLYHWEFVCVCVGILLYSFVLLSHTTASISVRFRTDVLSGHSGPNKRQLIELSPNKLLFDEQNVVFAFEAKLFSY